MYDLLLQAAQQAGKGNVWASVIMWTLVILIFYFLLIRPSTKRQKEAQKQRDAMKKGDKVITAGGIYGNITEVNDTFVMIEIANGVKIKVDKNSVSPAATAENTAKPEPKETKAVEENKETKE